MSDPAGDWLAYAEADLAAADTMVGDHETIAAYHGHQAAEKGLKALQIHREDQHDRTHDLVRLARHLDIPSRFRSSMEDLNPADTAARYPDAPEIEIENLAVRLEEIRELLTWIQTQLHE